MCVCVWCVCACVRAYVRVSVQFVTTTPVIDTSQGSNVHVASLNWTIQLVCCVVITSYIFLPCVIASSFVLSTGGI